MKMAVNIFLSAIKKGGHGSFVAIKRILILVLSKPLIIFVLLKNKKNDKNITDVITFNNVKFMVFCNRG